MANVEKKNRLVKEKATLWLCMIVVDACIDSWWSTRNENIQLGCWNCSRNIVQLKLTYSKHNETFTLLQRRNGTVSDFTETHKCLIEDT